MPITRKHKQPWMNNRQRTMTWENHLAIVDKEGDELRKHLFKLTAKREKLRRLKKAAKKREKKKRKLDLLEQMAGLNGLAKMKRAERIRQNGAHKRVF